MNFFLATIVPPHRIILPSVAPPPHSHNLNTEAKAAHTIRPRDAGFEVSMLVHTRKRAVIQEESSTSEPPLQRLTVVLSLDVHCQSSALRSAVKNNMDPIISLSSPSPHLPVSHIIYAQNDHWSSANCNALPVTPSASNPSASHPQRYNGSAPRKDAGSEGDGGVLHQR